ncbi:hypothetical protein CMO96_03815, partial [Candidatus Woesebacteria bacterium]|nr:hypothetical protein [Candidatus Woesebacteria bacterium]
MSKFLEDFEAYKDCTPPGVRLPKIKIEKKYYKLLDIKETTTNLDFLRALCHKGVKERGIDQFENKQEYYSRAKMELDILSNLGFIDYILLNWDVINFCHESDIPVGPGRGSAAGSLVLYLIGVTQVDPVANELFFERFVSKSRAKKTEQNGITYLDGSLLADVDNDIAYEHRQSVIQYIEEKYPSRTAKILTLNTLSGKLCIKECGKIVGEYDEQQVNEVSDSIPKHFGKVAPLAEALEESEKFRLWVHGNQRVYKIARKLEGLNKNTGVHPSGIAISYEEITEYCPLQRTGEGGLVTGYDMNWVSELMVKFDILGLRTLSVIYDACENLGINVYDIDLSSEALYKPLQNLKCPHGLFQIEADANYHVCKKVKPQNLEQLSAVIAIARPGALEFLGEYEKYVRTNETQTTHEFFDSILESTGGIPLYQEQLMKMAVKVGFTLDESEQLRRIVGKKKIEEMPAWKVKIETKISENNLDPEVGEVLWSLAEDSANYSFNKSHSLCYATLAAWTAYLKFTHPQQFALSLLRMTKYEPSPQEEIAKVTRELSHFGMKLEPPNLAKSDMDFSLEGSNIRFGLNSIKGVSAKSLQALKDFRESGTPTKYDIFIAAKQAKLNIGTLCALIQAGALSNYRGSRPLLVLEAQAFNLLTDREKRNFIALGDKYEYKLLNAIADAKSGEMVGDDGRPLMKESRFQTFKKKYDLYKRIYDRNSQFEKFASWYFENQLLGYSYTTNLKNVFSGNGQAFCSTADFDDMTDGNKARFIGVVS